MASDGIPSDPMLLLLPGLLSCTVMIILTQLVFDFISMWLSILIRLFFVACIVNHLQCYHRATVRGDSDAKVNLEQKFLLFYDRHKTFLAFLTTKMFGPA